MATRTMGTAGTTTLTALPFPNMPSAAVATDFAAIAALILDDAPYLWPVGNAGTANAQNATQIAAAHNRMPTAYARNGLLYVPNRGVLQVMPGDWVGVDGFGWPILVSGRSIQTSTASWAHSGNPS